jgi:hypothetical protein
MNQNSSSLTSNEAIYTVIGMVIGAILALIFAKTGSPGLIGVGAVLGLGIGKSLNWRYNKNGQEKK